MTFVESRLLELLEPFPISPSFFVFGSRNLLLSARQRHRCLHHPPLPAIPAHGHCARYLAWPSFAGIVVEIDGSHVCAGVCP